MFNKKLNLAIEALAYISLNSSQKAVSSKEICEALGVKLRYTESLMQQLVKAGVVKGVRGSGGGYFLANDRRKITVAEIYDIVESLKKPGDKEDISPFSSLSDEVNHTINLAIRNALNEITMEEIYNKALKIRMVSSKSRKSDFVI
jgi:Rrf2 family protein